MIVVKDVQKKNGEPAILVQTDFSDRWNKVAGQMGGQYSRAYEGRIFDADLRPQIIAALNDVFLHDGSDGPAVTLSVALGKLSIDDDSLLIGSNAEFGEGGCGYPGRIKTDWRKRALSADNVY